MRMTLRMPWAYLTKCDHRLRLQVNPDHDIDEVPDNENDTADAVGLFDGFIVHSFVFVFL